MAQNIFLSIDLGTQSARAACFDETGLRLSMAEAAYETRFPRSGWAEQRPAEWWEAICGCSRQATGALPDDARVRAVCVGATSSTVLPINADGEPLSDAILWMDTRSREECARVNATGHPILRYCGGGVSAEWMLPKTLWIKKNQPDLYAEAFKIVEALDWLNFKLSGALAASKCNASCKWTYSDVEGGFAEDFFKEIGFPEFREKWPTKVAPMGEPLGALTTRACQALGVKGAPILIQGGIDAHVGMAGLGAVVPGVLAVIMGTSFVHLGLSKEQAFIPGLWGPYSNAVIPGYSLLEGGQTSAGAITRWFKDVFAKDLGEEAYALLAEEAAAVEPGADGLTTLDYWQGSRTPVCDPDLTGAMWGMDLHHTRGHMYRAILESVAHGTRHILSAFTKGGYQVDSMAVCGGATKNPLWLQIIADVCQTPVVLTMDPDAVLLGGAMTASVGVGTHANFQAAADAMVCRRSVVNPDPSRARVYDEAHERYLATYEALGPLMRAMRKG
jgi:FGGY-family pentulose kinase